MLLKFGAKNFYSFKEGVEISLNLGASCPKSVSKGNKISNLLCVKGANGSGKSNLLKIVSFMRSFCCDSFTIKPDEVILIDAFFLNSLPIEFYCDFTSMGAQYRYEASLTQKKVVLEKVSRKKKRLTPIFTRENNKIVQCIEEFSELTKIKQRNNVSIISAAHQYEIEAIKPIYEFFTNVRSNVAWSGPVPFSADYKVISKFYKESPEFFASAREFIKNCDLGIADITIKKLKDEKGELYYFPIFIHDTKNENNRLGFHYQSLGTKTLYRSFPYYIIALNWGGVLVMDEFDTDFHPHLLSKIVNLFEDKKINKKNAQLIFSTHNTEIIDNMSKYRTVLVNKEESESYAYRLDEIPGDLIRNDRLIAPVYNSGKIGGVPRI
jgi:AAA15 family ATPase/GTPase